MGYWKFIVPEATTNLFSDPSFFLADPDTEWDISGDGAAPDWTRDTTYSFFGVSCAVADVDAGGGGTLTTIYQTFTTTATSYTVSAYVRRAAGGTLTNSQCVAWFDDGAHNWDSITHVGNNWYYCVYTGTATAAGNAFGVRALEDGLYVDGCQLENKAYATTYCDGTREGCEWDMGQHTDSSSRSAVSRAGGRVYDFDDDFSFPITDWAGWGMPPEILHVDSYALLAGGQINNIKTDVNVLTLTGYFRASSLSNLHTLRQALVEEMAHDKYPKTGEGWQPIRIRYTGATVHKEALVFYDSGLGGGRIVGYTENIPVRFLMVDPLWYELGESAAVLDSNATATLRYLGARLRSTGQWDDLGLTADPAAQGTISAICVASDGSVYFGGAFDGLNNDGAPADAGCDYVVRFDPSDESWNVLVGASDVNGTVNDIKEGPDGTIYLCGTFSAVNGVAANDYIVSYTPGTPDTWSPLGDPDSGAAAITSAQAMAFDSSGDLYVVGNFTRWADVADADYIARWDMEDEDWNAVGAPSGAGGEPRCIAIDSQDNIVIGGSFTDFAGDADADYLARWDGSSWADLGSGTQDGDVYSLEFNESGTLYLAGGFTNQGGDADCDYICAWNGRQFTPMIGGGTPDAPVLDLAVAPDGRVFAASWSWPLSEISSWNGSAWEVWDTDADARRIAIGPPDPTIPTNYDIWIGDDASASREIAGTATVTNAGTANRYPVFKVSRSGGDGATLYSLRNETTGKALMFNSYGLLDGETLTVDCRPGQRSIVSSFFGPRPDAILANSDFGSFALKPGSNQITCFVDYDNAPTVTAWLEWRDAYLGVD